MNYNDDFLKELYSDLKYNYHFMKDDNNFIQKYPYFIKFKDVLISIFFHVSLFTETKSKSVSCSFIREILSMLDKISDDKIKMIDDNFFRSIFLYDGDELTSLEIKSILLPLLMEKENTYEYICYFNCVLNRIMYSFEYGRNNIIKYNDLSLFISNIYQKTKENKVLLNECSLSFKILCAFFYAHKNDFPDEKIIFRIIDNYCNNYQYYNEIIEVSIGLNQNIKNNSNKNDIVKLYYLMEKLIDLELLDGIDKIKYL